MCKKILTVLLMAVSVHQVSGQELQVAKVTIIASKVSTSVDKKIFQTPTRPGLPILSITGNGPTMFFSLLKEYNAASFLQ